MTRIDRTLQKIAEDLSRANSQTISNTDMDTPHSVFPGDPKCPICGGVGFIRQDLPIDHPDFGKLQLCDCRKQLAQQSLQNRLFHLSNLEAFSQLTFETFNIMGRLGLGEEEINSLRYAQNQSLQFAQNLKGWLLLLGQYGCGKTHLAAAIANFAVRTGVPTLFLTVPDLLDWLRFSYNSTEISYEERFEEIRNIRLLVLDDLGTQNATSWAQEKLYQIINHRYVNRLPTVLTTNQDLREIEGRIRSRLEDPDLVTAVHIIAPDYRSPVRQTGRIQVSSLSLHSRYTFGNFSLREHEKMSPDEQQSLNKAFRAAQQFAEKPRGWLIFNGASFTGKTHLAAAIGNYRAAMGESPMFVGVLELLDHLRATFNPSSSISYDQLFEEIQSAQLLILDDLGMQSASPWAREKLYQILNHRYLAELPTVITTAQQLGEIEERIKSRMLDTRFCAIYAILVPPYRVSPGTAAAKPRQRGRRSTGDPSF